MSFELVPLKNGLKSLRALDNRETFHPVTGPAAEAEILHVRQQRIRERAEALGGFTLWDVGFGAAANAVAALRAWEGVGVPVELHSFDKTLGPAEFALAHAEELGYLLPYRELVRELLARGEVRHGQVNWVLHVGDFSETMGHGDIPAPDGVFYDPYSPANNFEMWNLAHFRAFRAKLTKPCLLTNYTRSTSVRVSLLLAGFHVGYGWGVGEKDQTTVAATEFSLLEHPLERNWLERVQISRNSAPIRSAVSPGPISAEDFTALAGLEQFTV